LHANEELPPLRCSKLQQRAGIGTWWPDDSVGEDDMRAQIEQAGKNIQACLQAAGANASDVILTRTYTTDTGAFSKNADMRARYLGPESATSTVVEVPKLTAGPDFLVEMETVATVN
jgi:enamine deaminase RidA (YjgF/YER057c/UK114 family)